jgi:hypothetical protein
LAAYAALCIAQIGEIRSLHADYAERGKTSEIDAAIWVPLMSFRRIGSALVPRGIAWLMPYVFVDSAAALATGREVYGFNKALAEVSLTRDHRGLTNASIASTVLKTHRAGETTQSAEVFRIERTRAANDSGLLWKSAEELFQSVMRRSASKAAPNAFNEINMVFLKQFRDAVDPTKACHQSIVEVPATISSFRGGGRLDGEYRVELSNFASHPMLDDLGLEPGPLTPSYGFWMDYDFCVGSGKEVWRAA